MAQSTSDEPRPARLNRVPTADQPKTCWICYSDSTEDDETTASTWRTPCPCALTAHEACLLDWVADLENPKHRKGTKPDKIQCPQCKSEIKIARSKSLVVEGMNAIDRLGMKVTIPGVIFTFAGTLWAGAFYYGFHTIYVVFGEEDAERILDHAAGHRGATHIGLPLIPLNLIMARTKYSDFFLPATTIFLIANQLYDSFELDYTIWPPTASTAFACLPLVRNTYNFLWEQAFGNLERKWMAEVQPRAGQDDDDNGEGNDGEHNGDGDAGLEEMGNGDVVLDLNIDIGIGGVDIQAEHDHDDAAPPPPPIANPNAQPNVAGDGAGDQVGPAGQAHQPNANQAQPVNPAPLAANANALVLETSSLASTVLGAMVFPWIAAGTGALLKYTLPATWTTPPLLHAPPMSPFTSETLSQIWSIITGRLGEKTASGLTRLPLLQTRWGRTVIGGCIFVVVKDIITLYWRWRVARSHRERRVMDWDRARGTWCLPGR